MQGPPGGGGFPRAATSEKRGLDIDARRRGSRAPANHGPPASWLSRPGLSQRRTCVDRSTHSVALYREPQRTMHIVHLTRGRRYVSRRDRPSRLFCRRRARGRRTRWKFHTHGRDPPPAACFLLTSAEPEREPHGDRTLSIAQAGRLSRSARAHTQHHAGISVILQRAPGLVSDSSSICAPGAERTYWIW